MSTLSEIFRNLVIILSFLVDSLQKTSNSDNEMEKTFPPNWSKNMSPTESEVNFPMDYTVTETAIAAATLLIIMITCLAGNAVICYVVLRNRRMWTEMNMFLVNLAIGDIAMALLSMTTPLKTAITRQWTYPPAGYVCQLNAFCSSVLICNTIFTHTVISVDRFFAVVKPMKKIMTRKKAFSSILGIWLLSVAVSLGPILGWGRNDYNASTLQCGFGFPENRIEVLYMIFLAVIAFLLPIIIMSYTYIRIYLVVRHHTRRMSSSTFGNNPKDFAKKQQRIVLTFFLALIAFIICWMPFFVFIAIAASISSRDELPHGLGLAAYWCGFLNCSINPYLIGLRSERFHETFAHVFCCRFCYCKRATGRRTEGRYSSDKTLCAETKNRTLIHQTSTPSQQSTGHVQSFLNPIAIINTSQETIVIPSRDKWNDNAKPRRSWRQENMVGVVYPNFIHMVDGKLWSEATV